MNVFLNKSDSSIDLVLDMPLYIAAVYYDRSACLKRPGMNYRLRKFTLRIL